MADVEERLELSAADQPAVGSVEHDEMSDFRTAYMAIVGVDYCGLPT